MTATDLSPAALMEALHAALDLDPSDAATRLMLADVLEDLDDRVGAQGQRWQALHGKWPAASGRDWRWWDEAYSERDDPDDLPSGPYGALSAGADEGMGGVARYYLTRRAAEADLALALEAVAAREARAAGYGGGPCPWCGVRRLVSSGREHACDGCGRGWAE